MDACLDRMKSRGDNIPKLLIICLNLTCFTVQGCLNRGTNFKLSRSSYPNVPQAEGRGGGGGRGGYNRMFPQLSVGGGREGGYNRMFPQLRVGGGSREGGYNRMEI